MSEVQTEKLTLQQAIEEGYLHYGFKDRDFQHLYPLTDLKPIDFEEAERNNETIVLFSKEPSFVPSIAGEEIAEMIADQVQCEIDSNTRDDDSQDSYDEIMKLNFDDAAKRVNEVLASRKYYTLTDIEVLR